MQFVQQFKLWPLHSVFLLPYFLHKVCRYVIHRKTENMKVDKRSRQALSWIWHWIVATGLTTFFLCFFIEGMITRGPWYLLHLMVFPFMLYMMYICTVITFIIHHFVVTPRHSTITWIDCKKTVTSVWSIRSLSKVPWVDIIKLLS